MIQIADAVAGLAWAAVSVLTIRTRGSLSALAALVAVAWFAAELLPSAALWHRALLMHLLLAAPGWWPRSRTARVVLLVEYVAAIAVAPWTHAIGTVALSALFILAFAVEPDAARRNAVRWSAVALSVAGFQLGPLVARDPSMSVAVTWVYAAGVLAVALLMLADARLRALPRAPVDLLIELGIAGDVGATPRERALARELQASHATLVDRLDEQLAELRDSRRRLAEASLTAAAELADDLHDRVRRPLAELFALRSPTGPAAARFDEARHHIQIVDAEISAILIGLGPRSLDDGLRDSLRALAEMCPIPTSLRVDDGPIPSRIVLHSAYLACAEALANVAKHSSASSATIDVRRRDDLELTITDDGSGGADPRRGTGLTGMRDRVEAIGGSLALSSTTSGTQIRIRLPLDVPEPHRAERSSVLLAQEEPR